MRIFSGRSLVVLVFLSILGFLYIQRESLSGRINSTPAATTLNACLFPGVPLTFKDDAQGYTYRRGVVRPRFDSRRKLSLGNIEGSFLSALESVPGTLTVDRGALARNCKDVSVASLGVDKDPMESHTGDIVLGVATELGRIEGAFASFARFVGGSNASLVAVVPHCDNLKERETSFRARGLDITLVASDLPFTRRYFYLVRALRSHIKKFRPHTKWAGLIDDDTFLSSIHQIGARLSALPYLQHHYIGGLSEAEWQLNNFGWMAFGGAGVFLSTSLLSYVDLEYEKCASEEIGPFDMPGDGRLAKCIYTVDPNVFVTPWDELRQWDLRGNADGIFESGKPIWSFHHWADSGWLRADVVKMSTVALIAGEKSMLRRWMFDRTGSGEHEKRDFYVLTNGFSIVRYTLEPGVEEIDFDKTEYTWQQDAPGYEDALGPFRPQHVEGITKVSWYLKDAIRLGSNIHQIYEHVVGDARDIIEIIWLGS